MSTPFLGIYLTSVLGISLTEAGVILGAFPLVIVLLSGVIGGLTDRLSLRKILVSVAFLWGILFMLFFFASTFWQFLLLNSLNGCCYALFEPNAKKVLSQETSPQDRLLAYNLRYAFINVGGFLGPLLSQLFQTQDSLAAYVFLGLCYLLYSLTLFVTLKPIQRKITHVTVLPSANISRRRILTDFPFLFLLMGVSFSYFGYSQFNSTLAQYLTLSPLFKDGSHIYASIISFNSACILIFQLGILKVTKSFSATPVLIFSNLLLAISVILCGFSQHLSSFLVVSLIYSLGELLLGSRFDALVDSLAPQEAKSRYFGFAETIKSGSVLGPIIGGHLLGTFGPNANQVLFTILGLITLTGSLFLWISGQSIKKSPTQKGR